MNNIKAITEEDMNNKIDKFLDDHKEDIEERINKKINSALNSSLNSAFERGYSPEKDGWAKKMIDNKLKSVAEPIVGNIAIDTELIRKRAQKEADKEIKKIKTELKINR